MINKPYVSVILPVYNGDRYLRESIESILNQTYPHFELIIINDGSTDNTDSIIKSYREKRIRHISRENKGLVYTLNEGIQLSQGDFIARQDADDISALNRFEKQVDFLLNDSDYVIVGSFAKVINEQSEPVDYLYRPRNENQIFTYLPFQTPFIHGSVMFRSIVREKKVYYKDFLHVEDYEYWYRILNLGKGYNLSNFLYYYRDHTQNISNKHSNCQICNAIDINNIIQGKYLSNRDNLARWSFEWFIDDIKYYSDWEKNNFSEHALRFSYMLLNKRLKKNAVREFKYSNNLQKRLFKEKIKFYTQWLVS